MQYLQLVLTIIIILKLFKMSPELEEIKANLIKSNELTAAIKADVAKLDGTISQLGNAPSVEELQQVKQLSADLVSSLQSVDDLTPDAPVEPPVVVPTV